MWRKVGAFVAGLLSWGAVGALAFWLLRVSWPEYVVAEPAFAFTLSMQWARLLVGVICSLAAGCVVAFVVGRRSLVPWILGVTLAVVFTPVHIQLWDKFPVWYHLFFLTTLAPLLGFGAKMMPQPATSIVAPQPA